MDTENLMKIINLYLENYKTSKIITDLFTELSLELSSNPELSSSPEFLEKFQKYQEEANETLFAAFSLVALQNPERFDEVLNMQNEELPKVVLSDEEYQTYQNLTEEDIEAADILRSMMRGASGSEEMEDEMEDEMQDI